MKYINYKKKGKCAVLTDGITETIVTCDFGSRIISFRRVGGQNLLFEDTQGAVTLGGEYFDKTYGLGAKWQLHGGHRLWKSPEDYTSYELDNNPVEVTENADGSVSFSSPVDKITNLKKTLILSYEKGELKIVQQIMNTGDKTIDKIAAWGITAMAAGGVARIPFNRLDKSSLLPDRCVCLWGYSSFTDERLSLTDNELKVTYKKGLPPLKVGVYGSGGEYTVNGETFKMRLASANRGAPDFECNMEIYTNSHYTEFESVGSATTLSPNETVESVIYWSIK